MNRQPIGFEGIEDEEGNAILQQLYEHATQPHLVYRHRWTPGDLIVWDNLSSLHSATDIGPYENDRRLMYRSFVYMTPTTYPLVNLDEINALFTDNEGKGSLVLP
jgi:alpha-ketoglutarate-dependent taurine dioxygenase